MGQSGALPAETTDRVRIHITPFNPDLLDRIIPPSLKHQTTSISFHSVQTFPERGYGFVELPVMAAEKLKNKLNGTTLKGSKVKIEDAKPEKNKMKRGVEEDDEQEGAMEKAARKKARKERKQVKQEDGVLLGHELEEGRHVKRGWVDDVAKKSKSKRSGEDGIEGKKMKFKTVVPPNKVVAVQEVGKEKKAKKEEKEKEKKDRRNGKKTAVVKEFDNTRRPADAAILAKPVEEESIYEDGKGWVNGSGEIVETEPKSAQRRREIEATKRISKPSRDPSRRLESSRTSGGVPEGEADSLSDDLDSASSIISSDSDSGGDGNNEDASPGAESSETVVTKQVHPLEALFKRPAPDVADSLSKPKPARIDTSFNFFNSSDAASVVSNDNEAAAIGGAGSQPPQTPHTRQDMEWRGLRSAAPTPDTAAVGKHFSFPFGNEDEDKDDQQGSEEDEEMENGQKTLTAETEGDGKEESEFRKWFYENRGDLNRGWKKRRREERKTKRQRDNRKVGRRVV